MQVKCENCGQENSGVYGSGRFCEAKCARGFSTKSKRNEINERVSKTLQLVAKNDDNFGFKDSLRQQKANTKAIKVKKENSLEFRKAILTKPFAELKYGHIRYRVMHEQEYKCAKCGLSEWLDDPITLELEHKNGNNQDNNRDNLECLCPNCHSKTKTWRGRNKKAIVSDEEFKEALKTESSIRQALLKVGLSAKGANYSRAKRLKADATNQLS